MVCLYTSWNYAGEVGTRMLEARGEGISGANGLNEGWRAHAAGGSQCMKNFQSVSQSGRTAAQVFICTDPDYENLYPAVHFSAAYFLFKNISWTFSQVRAERPNSIIVMAA